MILHLSRMHRNVNWKVYNDRKKCKRDSAGRMNDLGRMRHLRDLHITFLNVVVSQQLDIHFYLTRCLNVPNHKTCTHLPQNMLYCAKDGIFITCQDR